MRAAILTFGLTVMLSLAACAPQAPMAANETPSYACPAGWHWVPADYAKHAKWRPGHCAY